MRWLVRLAATVMVGVVLVAGMVVLMPKDGVAQRAADGFAAATGRAMTVQGPFQARVWPVLGVRTGPVSIANADWGSAPEMLTASAMDIGLDFSGLLNGQARISAIRLIEPEIVIERAADGRVNWQIAQAPAPGGFGLANLAVRDGTLRLFDQITGAEVYLGGLRADLALADMAGPAQLAFSAEDGAFNAGGTARVAALGGFLAGTETELAADLVVNGMTFGFAGKGALSPLRADGRLTADLSPLAAGAAPPGGWHLPGWQPAASVTLGARAVLSAQGALHLRGAELLADGARVAGDLDWQQGPERPRIAAKLALGAVNLPLGQRDAGTPGWSETTIDAGVLALADADLAITAEKLTVGPLKLGATRARITLDQRRAVVVLDETAAYGGTVAGQVVANNRDGLSVAADLRFSGMELQPLLHDTAGLDPLTGRGDLTVRLLGVGDSEAAIMESLSGEARLKMGRGEMLGIDIAGMLRTMDPGYVGEGRKTAFDSLSFGLAIRDGVAENPDLTITSADFVASGAGKIGIGERSFAYRLLPRLMPRSDGTGGVEVPVLISGPWEAPEVRLDLDWLSDARAAAEKARAEELARQRLQELARDPEPVLPLPGETPEETARRAAQQPAD